MIQVNSFRAAAHQYVFIVGWFIDVQHMWCPGNQVRYCCNSTTLITTQYFSLYVLSESRSLVLAFLFTTALPPPSHRRRGFISSALVESNQFLIFQKNKCSQATKIANNKCSLISFHTVLELNKCAAEKSKTATNTATNLYLRQQEQPYENLLVLFFFSIFPSPDQELNPSVLPAAHNTGGSLPDLTNIQFPPPLSTPLDPEDTVAFPSLSSSNSTGSLTTNLTHLGISVASHGNNREENFFFMQRR